MEIKITPEQEAALARSGADAQDVFDRAADEHVRVWAQRDAEDVKALLAKNITTMTPEDRETVVAVLTKYQIAAPIEIEPIIEEVIVP